MTPDQCTAAVTAEQARHAMELRADGKAVPDIAALVNVSRYTVYRTLNRTTAPR